MKAILLVRVSTKAQDFDEQEREIYEMAIKDGYSPDNIIPICEKESGIKLSEEERAGLNRMKELIETDNTINCVYCWEVSRIARRKKINFSVLEYLTSHRIQLVIKNPSIRLFKDNGDIDEGAEIIFTLFSQMAESEMRTKLARWKRTKDAKRKESYYTGGWLLYGYKVDEATRKIVPDENSAVVERIFNMYLTGNYSYGSLAKEMLQIGLFNCSLNTARSLISNILNNTAYAGMPSSTNGFNKLKTEGNVYPPIVTLEMIERCKKIAEGNIYKPKKQYNNYYFGKGLLKCPYCGGAMVAKKNNNTYHCQNCDKGFWIQINLVDSILWYASSLIYLGRMTSNNDEAKKQYQQQLETYDNKITTSENAIASLQNRIEMIEHRTYVDGTLSISKADSFIKELNTKIGEESKTLNKWKNEQSAVKQMLIDMESEITGVTLETIGNIKDDETRFKIIHEVLDYAFIDKLAAYQYNISIYPILSEKPLQFLLDTKKNKAYTDLRNVNGINRLQEINCYEQRFKPVRDKEKNREYNVKYCQEHKEENAKRQREYRARQKALKEDKK